MRLPNKLLIGLAAWCWFAAAAPVTAQPPFANSGPTAPRLSPYLNLLNQNTPGVSNYFTLVKPQLDAQRQFRSQQQQISQLQRSRNTGISPRGSNDIRATGHDTTYMNYSHYYQFPGRR